MGITKYLNIKAVWYFVIFTLVNYFLFIRLTPIHNLGFRLLIVISDFIIIYVVARIFYGNPFRHHPLTPYFESLIHVLTLLVPGYILSVIPIVVSGTRQIYLDAKPSFVDVWSTCLPGYALIHWGFVSIIVAYFFHSTTYELFSKESRLAGIMASTILFTINYNIPLVSNYWNVWDILFFGFAFAYSYSVKKNPLALLTAYILSEVPLWWCILAPSGKTVFASYFFIRFVISIIALVVFVKNWSKKK